MAIIQTFVAETTFTSLSAGSKVFYGNISLKSMQFLLRYFSEKWKITTWLQGCFGVKKIKYIN